MKEQEGELDNSKTPLYPNKGEMVTLLSPSRLSGQQMCTRRVDNAEAYCILIAFNQRPFLAL